MMDQDIPNFDTLLHLAENDPSQLEQIRQRLATRTINSAPKYLRPRLRGLQFKIDSTRQLAKTPLSACIQLSGMMHQSFEELREVLNRASSAPREITVAPQPSATIINFPRSYNSSSRQRS